MGSIGPGPELARIRLVRSSFGIEDTGVVLDVPLPRLPAGTRPGTDLSPGPATKPAKRAAPAASARPARSAKPVGPARVDAAEARRVPEQRHALGGNLPWILLLLVLGGAGAGSLYLWQRFGIAADAAAQAERDRSAAQENNARLDREVMATTAALTRAQAKLAAAQTRASGAESDVAQLAKDLEQVVSRERGEVRREGGRVTVDLVDPILFRSAEATLTDRGRELLLELGDILNHYPDRQISIQGHTEDVRTGRRHGRFASNWDLSAARALTVVHYLQDDALVDPRRLSAVAFGEHRPGAPKPFKNRRIEMVLGPAEVEIEP